MRGKPYGYSLRSTSRIVAGPVYDRTSPLDMVTAAWICVGCCMAVAVWIAWGCGLPVGETRR